ncbi:MAG: hypothetical protein JO278_03365 [Dyella sp.]|nr:hypothetical protein [Dyella sp.]
MSILYAGLDVSLEQTSVCVINAEGNLVKEVVVPSDPPSIVASLLELGGTFERVGLDVSDNGTELTSNAVLRWAADQGIEWQHRGG